MIEFRNIDFDNDMELCLDFRRDSYQASFPNSDKWKALWNESQYRSWIMEHAKRFPGGALHVWEGTEIIGQLEFAWFEESGHVNLYYLRSDKRGVGYGTLLQTRVASTLREKGCKTATLRVNPRNLRAVNFYLKHGWLDCGPDRNYDSVRVFRINL